MSDTIVAQVTPFGYGGIGIIRVSGTKAKEVAKTILKKIPKPRYADFSVFKDIEGNPLDKGIAIWFPSPNSFTGEDVLELQGHGGPVVLDLLLNQILKITDVRIARPGEFSERAFLNGKIDLSQAEAIIDLIQANSEEMVRSAVNSLQGKFSSCINHLINQLVHLRTYLEVSIDFPDEEIDFLTNEEIKIKFDEIMKSFDSIYSLAHHSTFLREGKKVVITGRPNAGKSSLLNLLTDREVAIVTDIPGTTRDVLKEHIHINGMLLQIIDTAGLRSTDNRIEKISIDRSYKEIQNADLLLIVVDSSTTNKFSLKEIYLECSSHLRNNFPIIIVRNKIDLTKEISGFVSTENGNPIIQISTHTKEGIDVLLRYIKKEIKLKTTSKNNYFLVRQRHIQSLEKTKNYLKKGKKQLMKNFPFGTELIAEELRLAQEELNNIIGGKFTSEDLLKKIFSDFCIGK